MVTENKSSKQIMESSKQKIESNKQIGLALFEIP